MFVNFVDHGAPGLLAFPSDELYADDLIKALRKMAVNRQFAQVRRAEIIMAKKFFSQSVSGRMEFCSLFVGGTHDLRLCYYKTLPCFSDM